MTQVKLNLDQLEDPPPEAIRFIREALEEPRGKERRTRKRFNIRSVVPALPVDSELRAQGAPFKAVTRDLSAGGIALFAACEPKTSHLVIELPLPNGGTVQLLAEVIRTRQVGPVFEIATQFVRKLSAK